MTDARDESPVATYREAAPEAHTGPEVTLLRCDIEVRQGVPFGVVVTDRSFMYLRPVSFRLIPAEWTAVPLERMRDVTLSARSPWTLRALGMLCVAAVALVLYAASSGAVTTLDVRAKPDPLACACARKGVAVADSPEHTLVQHRLPMLAGAALLQGKIKYACQPSNLRRKQQKYCTPGTKDGRE